MTGGWKNAPPSTTSFLISFFSLIIPRIYFHGSNKTGFKKSKTFSRALENLCIHEKRRILFICSCLPVFVQFAALCSCVIPFGVSCLSSCLLVFRALSSCITITLFTLYLLPLYKLTFLSFSVKVVWKHKFKHKFKPHFASAHHWAPQCCRATTGVGILEIVYFSENCKWAFWNKH